MPDERRFLFILGSNRAGTSEALARRAAAALPADVTRDWRRLSDLPLPAFLDTGHGADVRSVSKNERVLLDATLAAGDLVIVSPLYWYNMSAGVKLYLDHWGAWLRDPRLGFRERMRGKVMWAVVTAGGEDTTKCWPLLESLRMSAEYLGMRWGGDLVGQSRRRGPSDTDALELAGSLFRAGVR
jgi:NAD(P)H-dependent FMN reductase